MRGKIYWHVKVSLCHLTANDNWTKSAAKSFFVTCQQTPAEQSQLQSHSLLPVSKHQLNKVSCKVILCYLSANTSWTKSAAKSFFVTCQQTPAEQSQLQSHSLLPVSKHQLNKVSCNVILCYLSANTSWTKSAATSFFVTCQQTPALTHCTGKTKIKLKNLKRQGPRHAPRSLRLPPPPKPSFHLEQFWKIWTMIMGTNVKKIPSQDMMSNPQCPENTISRHDVQPSMSREYHLKTWCPTLNVQRIPSQDMMSNPQCPENTISRHDVQPSMSREYHLKTWCPTLNVQRIPSQDMMSYPQCPENTISRHDVQPSMSREYHLKTWCPTLNVQRIPSQDMMSYPQCPENTISRHDVLPSMSRQ